VNVYKITYIGVEYEETAANIADAIQQFLLTMGGRTLHPLRQVEFITKVELV
jgi:hypothetical protein